MQIDGHGDKNQGPVLLTKNSPEILDEKQKAKRKKALEDFLKKTGHESDRYRSGKWTYRELHVLYSNRYK